MLANDRQGLVTERAAGQYCVSWVGPGSGSTQTSETQETLILGGLSNTSDNRGKTLQTYTACEVKNTCKDLTGGRGQLWPQFQHLLITLHEYQLNIVTTQLP